MGDLQEKIDTAPRPHDVAKVAQDGFGKNASAYDKNRPSYTDAIVDMVLEEVRMPRENSADEVLKYEILELGAGTGKLTELVAPKIPSGYRYLATEPSQDFLGHLESKGLPIDTANAWASKIPLPNNSVQNILCAQCLHWFCDEASLTEIHRVLVPGGKLIAVANVKDFDAVDWMREIYKQRWVVMEKTGSSSMFVVGTMEWKKALEATGLFTQARHASLPGIDNRSNLESILNHLRTLSCYNALPEDECQRYLDQLKQAILSCENVNPDDMSMPFNSMYFAFTTI